ncbi:MAG: hypothetical protein R2941_23960 [Desulfobacterales bacterium]
MQIKKSEIHKIFKKLELEIRSTDHHYGWLTYKGRKILRVHFSHGKGDIPGKVTEKIRSQLKLSQNDFKNLINCPLSLDDYIEILKIKGLIE